jgi:hypothetical protein
MQRIVKANWEALSREAGLNAIEIDRIHTGFAATEEEIGSEQALIP